MSPKTRSLLVVPWNELQPLGLTPGHDVATVQVTNSEGGIVVDTR